MSDTTTAREWFSAKELAGLPELPSTERRVRTRAEINSWQSRKKESGKGFEYRISSLPDSAQKELRRRSALAAATASSQQAAATDEHQRLQKIEHDAGAWAQQQRDETIQKTRARQRLKEDGLAQFHAMPASDKKDRALARKWLLEASWQFSREHGGAEKFTRVLFAEAVNSGAFPVPRKYAAFLPQYDGRSALTEPTLRKWHYDYINTGIMGLVDGYGARKDKSVIQTTPALLKLVLGLMLKFPHITAKKIKQYLEAAHADLNLVSEKAIHRFKISWIEANHQLWTYISNPDRWKNVYMAAPGSQHENITELNQMWEMDSTPGDWLLIDGRHSVVGVIDLYSRRLKMFVSKTSSAYAVCQTFRRAALAWGLPGAVRTDNGKDYVSEHFNTVLNDLEIKHELCVPFASEEKGTIERSMRTMSHGILDLLTGFIGHSVGERKSIEARKSFADRIMKPGEVVEVALTAAELQKKLDQWCDAAYAHDVHGGLNGKTPWQVANAWMQPIRKVGNERALDALLAPVDGERVIGKKGIRLDKYDYFSEAIFAHVGESAALKLDEQDIGRVHVYVHGNYIGVAECPELLGISRREKAVSVKSAQKKLLSTQSQEFKEYSRDIKSNIAEVVLQHRIDTAPNVTELPKRSEEYSTPALEQAALSIRSYTPPRNDDIAADAQTVLNNLFTLNAKPLSNHQRILDGNDACEMYLYWTALEQRLNTGEQLSVDEDCWFESFPHSSFFEAGKVVAEMRQQSA